VFKDASTYTCIVNLTRTKKARIKFKKVKPLELSDPFKWDNMSYDNLSSSNWDLQSEEVYNVIKHLKQQPYTISDVFENIFQGIATSLDAVYVFEGIDKGDYMEGYNSQYDYQFEIEKELVKPILGGRDVFKYHVNPNPKYVLFPYFKDGTPVSEEHLKNRLPKTYSYLKHFETEIRGRERGRMDIQNGWYLYIYPKSLTKFPFPKIMTREISLGCNMTYDPKGDYYHNTKVYSFVKNQKFDVDEKYYLGILNSKVMWFFLKNTGSEYGGGYYVFKTNYLKPFPLPEIPKNPSLMIGKVNQILSSNKNLQEASSKFQRTLQRKFKELDKLSKRLENWYELTFSDFIKELKKKKIKLSLAEEAEWEEYFLIEQQKCLEIKKQIDATDKEIDNMVYKLYDLTDEEITIIEND
jgi:predicted CopG family antitoxin